MSSMLTTDSRCPQTHTLLLTPTCMLEDCYYEYELKETTWEVQFYYNRKHVVVGPTKGEGILVTDTMMALY